MRHTYYSTCSNNEGGVNKIDQWKLSMLKVGWALILVSGKKRLINKLGLMGR